MSSVFTRIPVDSFADPRVADYVDIRDHELMQRNDPLDPAGHRGLFVAEGDLVVRRLLDSPYRTKSVLITPTRLDAMLEVFPHNAGSLLLAQEALRETDCQPIEPLAQARGETPVPIYVVSQELMNDVVGFNIHRGVLAVGIRPEPPTLDHLLDGADLVVVLEDLTNHDNLGSIYRNIAGLVGGGARVVLSPRCADPLYRKSLRVSMGHVLGVPTMRSADWRGDLERLKSRGFVTLALTPDPAADDLAEVAVHLPGKLALLLGAEGSGLIEATMTLVDRRVRIPMAGGVDSLNVATAGAITLFCVASARRRNKTGPGHVE